MLVDYIFWVTHPPTLKVRVDCFLQPTTIFSYNLPRSCDRSVCLPAPNLSIPTHAQAPHEARRGASGEYGRVRDTARRSSMYMSGYGMSIQVKIAGQQLACTSLMHSYLCTQSAPCKHIRGPPEGSPERDLTLQPRLNPGVDKMADGGSVVLASGALSPRPGDGSSDAGGPSMLPLRPS